MFPRKYVPTQLSREDKTLQLKALKKSKRDYLEGKYSVREKIKSFKSKPSRHVVQAKKIYNITNIKPSRILAKKTGCKISVLKEIEAKGMGAYYSGGSRPSQTAHSWGRARLASAISGGKAAAVDYKILGGGCNRGSIALKLAKRAKQKHGYGQRRVPKVKNHLKRDNTSNQSK
tara:strand:- start:8696 stop:9217 length:522 start_codon:yes stop_codon:yes gene_type:complete